MAHLSSVLLLTAGLVRGSIRVELYDINKATLIKAHDADLSQFALNVDGRSVDRFFIYLKYNSEYYVNVNCSVASLLLLRRALSSGCGIAIQESL